MGQSRLTEFSDVKQIDRTFNGTLERHDPIFLKINACQWTSNKSLRYDINAFAIHIREIVKIIEKSHCVQNLALLTMICSVSRLSSLTLF